MTTVPLSEAENRLPELVDSVDRTHDRVLITRNGRETALLMSVRDYESLEATLELAMDPAAQGRLREARAEIDAGEMVDSRRGEYRLRYEIDDVGETVTVLDVEHRREAYRS